MCDAAHDIIVSPITHVTTIIHTLLLCIFQAVLWFILYDVWTFKVCPSFSSKCTSSGTVRDERDVDLEVNIPSHDDLSSFDSFTVSDLQPWERDDESIPEFDIFEDEVAFFVDLVDPNNDISRAA
jgi:hypothetical protein